MKLARTILPNLSPEEELILLCARTQMGDSMRLRLHQLLASKLNWTRIDEIAALHRMRPLLFNHIKRENLGSAVPTAIWSRIQKHAGWTIGRNFTQIQELARTITLLRHEGVEAMPFKGPVLAVRTYHNLGIREFFDLDLLVHRDELAKARAVLNEAGYTNPPEQTARAAEHLDAQLGHDFLSADGRVRLELHWSFIQKWLSYRVNLDGIWRRAVLIDVAGVPCRTVASEDLLPYLCAHGAKHHWERLFWIVDIAEFVRAEKKFDWDGVLASARADGNWRVVALGLYLAKALLDAPLTDAIWRQIDIPSVQQLAQLVGSWLFTESKRPATGDLIETRFYLKSKERVPDRVAYTSHLLKLTLAPSEKDRAFVKLPAAFSFLYPAIRPVRWLINRN